TRQVDPEVARNRKAPCVQPCCAVILGSSQENPHPALLEEILRNLALACHEKEITHETMLIALNQLIEQFGILPLQSVSDCRIFTLDLGSLRSRERHGTSSHILRDALAAREDSLFR